MSLLTDFLSWDNNDKIGTAKGALVSFSSSLPDKHRAAIMLLVLEIAYSNDKLTNSESNMITSVLAFLGIASDVDPNLRGQQVMKKIADNLDISEAINLMSELNDEQQAEVLIWFCALANMDEPSGRSLNIITDCANTMRIDLNRFIYAKSEVIAEFVRTL